LWLASLSAIHQAQPLTWRAPGQGPPPALTPIAQAAGSRWRIAQSTGEVEVFLNPFEEKMTEDETEGTVYVRMPANLKRRIEVLAESAGLSANAWAIRCFEQCANATQRLARSE
jgi:hypothetical protein